MNEQPCGAAASHFFCQGSSNFPLVKSSPSFIRSYFRKIPFGMIALLALFAGALILFVVIVHEVLSEQEEQADLAIFHFLSLHVISNSLTGFMKTVTHFASSTFLQIAYGLLVILYLFKKDIKRAVEIGVIGIGGFLVNYVMKLSFQRQRPPDPLMEPLQNFSFPSGHATSGFIFYGLLVYLLWKTKLNLTVKYIAAIILISFALLIGFSRVYLRMHYPSDVLAGFCIGFSWLVLSIYILTILKKKTDREISRSEIIRS